MLANSSWRTWSILAGIIFAGLLVRFWGLSWGLPDRMGLHPDEHDYVVQHALEVSWRHPDPGFINYPSFLCYSTALLHGGLKWLQPGRPDWKAYRVARSISAAYGAATILMVFLLARRLGGGPRQALLAAAWTAALPLHVWDSHVGVTDVMMTFWIVLALLMSLRLCEEPAPRVAALTGLCVGLSVGSKYTATVVALAPMVALCLARIPWGRRVALLSIVAGCALGACFAVTPFSFIRLHDTLAALAEERAHVMGHHLGFSLPADGWQYHRGKYQLLAAWPFSMGVPLYLAALVGSVRFLFDGRAGRPRWVIVCFLTVFLALTLSMHLVPLRYYMPFLVLGALFAGLWLGAEQDVHLPAWRRWLALAATLVVTVYTTAFTLSTTRRYARETRVAADRWINDHLQPGHTLHYFGWGRYCAIGPASSGLVQAHSEVALRNADAIATEDLIEVTSLHYLRWLRHGARNQIRMYAHIRRNPADFEQVALFDAPFLNREFYGHLDPMFRSYFVSPTIEIYRHLHVNCSAGQPVSPAPQDPEHTVHGPGSGRVPTAGAASVTRPVAL